MSQELEFYEKFFKIFNLLCDDPVGRFDHLCRKICYKRKKKKYRMNISRPIFPYYQIFGIQQVPVL